MRVSEELLTRYSIMLAKNCTGRVCHSTAHDAIRAILRPILERALMADADDVRRIALGLPHVVEIPSEGFDFRVGNKGFVWSWPEYVPGERRHIRTDVAVLYVGDESEKQALLLGEPDLSSPRAAMTGYRW